MFCHKIPGLSRYDSELAVERMELKHIPPNVSISVLKVGIKFFLNLGQFAPERDPRKATKNEQNAH